MTAEELARFFHETYERLAPLHSYKTRDASAVPWQDVPPNNKRLMIATCEEVLDRLGLTDEGVEPIATQPLLGGRSLPPPVIGDPMVPDLRKPPPVPDPPTPGETSKDPHVGWYEYRGARFHIQRYAKWGGFSYYVSAIKLPWYRGTLLDLKGGWFAWTAPRMCRKLGRIIDKEYAARQRNGESVEPAAEALDWLSRDENAFGRSLIDKDNEAPEGMRVLG